MKKESTTDRVVTKRAEEVLVGDRLYRSSGVHPVITNAAHNDLYAGFIWEENGVVQTRTMAAWYELQIVLPDR